MTRTQINYFLEVAKTASFSKAASNLYVSQPAVSKQIALLENELGITLFDRSDKVVRLTEAGTALRNFQLRYDRDLNTLVSRMKSHTNSAYKGNITIGCRASWNLVPFYRNICNIFSYWPEINIRLSGYELGEIINMVRSGEVDFGLVYGKTGEKQPDLLSVPFTTCGFDLLFSAEFVGESGAPTLKDFANVDFVMVENYVGDFFRRYTETLCAEQGFTPNFRRCRTMHSALMEVSCNRGVMVVDSREMSLTNSVYHHIPLKGELSIELVYLAKNSTPLKDFFLSEVQSKIQNEPNFNLFV